MTPRGSDPPRSRARKPPDRGRLTRDIARLQTEAARRRREDELFAEVISKINASLDLDAILQRVAEAAKELVHSDQAVIALRDPSSPAMVFRHWAGARYGDYASLRIEPGKGSGGQVLRTRRPFRTDNYAEDPRITKDYLASVRANRVIAQMVLPIQAGDLLEGLLYVENRRARPFTDQDEALLVRLAGQAAIAITNARLFAREREARAGAETAEAESRAARSHLELLLASTGEGIYGIDREGRCTFLNRAGERMLGCTAADALGQNMHALIHHHRPDGSPYPESECPIAGALRTGPGVRIQDEVLWRRDGTSFAAEYSWHPLIHGEALAGAVVTFSDITERKRAEAVLRESEQQYREFVEGSVQGVYIQQDLIIRFANRSMARIFGYERPDDLVGQDYRVVIAPDEHARVEGYRVAHRRGEEVPSRYEMRGARRDGAVIWVEVLVSPVRWAGWPATLATFLDITERKRAEQHLAAQYAVARLLADAADLDAAGPPILEAIGRALGWDVGEIWIVEPGEAVLRLQHAWRAGAASGRQFEAAGRQMTVARGVGLPGRVWASGAPAWIRDVTRDENFPRAAAAAQAGLHAAFGFPMQLGPQTLGVLQFFSHDIRSPDDDLLEMAGAVGRQIGQFIERKRAEAALRRSEEQNARLFQQAETRKVQFEQMFASTSDGMLLLDPSGRIVALNPQSAEFFGVVPDEVVGHPVARLVEKVKETGIWSTTEGRALLAAIERETERAAGDLEVRFPTARTLHWQTAPSRDTHGHVMGLTITLQDVTRDREVSRMKSDFVSFVTHQLRTPLAGVRWMLELTEQLDGVPDDARSFIQDARQATHRLIGLVNDLLDISRLESGTLSPEFQATSLREVTRSVVDELAPLIREKRHRLVIDGDGEIPAVVADPQLLRQVVLNLVSNAIKYTPGDGTIEIRLRCEGSAVLWAIRDSGIGVPDGASGQLFEKFYRAANAAALETEGTGLGLYLVRLIVERLGGRIWCESELGVGSTFSFTVPVHR